MSDRQGRARTRGQWAALVVLAALAGAAAAALSSYRHPTVYQATATVQIISAVTGNDTHPADLQFAADLVTTYARTIKSSAVLSDVRAELRLHDSLADLDQQIEVQPVAGTNLLTIAAYGGSADEAAGLANSVAAVFIRRTATERAAPLANERAGLEQRLAANEAALSAALLRQERLRALFTPVPAPVQQELATLADTIPGYQQNRAGLRHDLDILRQLQAFDNVPARVVDPAMPPADPVAVRGALGLSVAAAVGALAAAGLFAALAYTAGTLKRET